jgi:hypothetical protein
LLLLLLWEEFSRGHPHLPPPCRCVLVHGP